MNKATEYVTIIEFVEADQLELPYHSSRFSVPTLHSYNLILQNLLAKYGPTARLAKNWAGKIVIEYERPETTEEREKREEKIRRREEREEMERLAGEEREAFKKARREKYERKLLADLKTKYPDADV